MQKSGRTKKAIDPQAVEVGRRIREARKAQHMTGEQLAEAADTSFQFLSKVEKGEQCMTTGKFARLVKALGVSSDYLLFGRDDSLGRTALAAEYLGGLDKTRRDMVSEMLIALQETMNAVDGARREHE